eukprot:g3679.t1
MSSSSFALPPISPRTSIISPRRRANFEKQASSPAYWRDVARTCFHLRQKRTPSKWQTSADDTKRNAIASLGASRNQDRAAGLPVFREENTFERQLEYKLKHVKGIDLDGDGQIDDDELDYAKELESRKLRSEMFMKMVADVRCPWSFFGSFWSKKIKDGTFADFMMRDKNFDLRMKRLRSRLKQWMSMGSNGIKLALTYEESALNAGADTFTSASPRMRKSMRQSHEQEISNFHSSRQAERRRNLQSDPLSLQPSSFRQYLTRRNPITGRFVYE